MGVESAWTVVGVGVDSTWAVLCVWVLTLPGQCCGC